MYESTQGCILLLLLLRHACAPTLWVWLAVLLLCKVIVLVSKVTSALQCCCLFWALQLQAVCAAAAGSLLFIMCTV